VQAWRARSAVHGHTALVALVALAALADGDVATVGYLTVLVLRAP
jgi:hypothetical protein